MLLYPTIPYPLQYLSLPYITPSYPTVLFRTLHYPSIPYTTPIYPTLWYPLELHTTLGYPTLLYPPNSLAYLTPYRTLPYSTLP